MYQWTLGICDNAVVSQSLIYALCEVGLGIKGPEVANP